MPGGNFWYNKLMLKIITVPAAILHKKSTPIKKIDQEITTLAKKMIDVIRHGSEDQRIGVGLSAVQVGHPLRLLVVYDPEPQTNLILVNPKITWRSAKMTQGLDHRNFPYEGCLSVPQIFGLVKRHQAIKAHWQDLAGKIHAEKFSGFVATVIQHEEDHLNGILFTQRVLEQQGQLYRLEPTNNQDVLIPIKL
ncbi:peptide deformylase [Candidatus Shapirobacteria bacterium CG10_big_fil_rev_8_21_14_0_10_48_15]|uniref:Peptide deformylase n=1 Tax=Candidatus Shapirobacteria bacterium CG10_big_fil_rev_8_21_14_0_10_48_15 TaxID=1974484 RepID=A0A2M8L794_9BACT|nr:MAG: peptide deformylase [Candidatus Shapirobacteria bacterium CG10_big_fil_rev_8_21_14_0_10_48_15]